LFFVYAKITSTLTHSALTSILAGVSKHSHALLAMLAKAIFDRLFIKKQYLSNGQASCREIPQNIANRWLFMVQKNNSHRSLFIKLF